MPEPLMEGYKELWGGVLARAINDALCEAPNDKELIKAKREAIAWFDRPDENFAMVCTFAGFDPVAVYQAWKAKRIRLVGQFQAGGSPERASAQKNSVQFVKSKKTKDELRADILSWLASEPMTVCEIRDRARVGNNRVREIISELRDGGFVEMKRVQSRRYSYRKEYRLTEQREAAE